MLRELTRGRRIECTERDYDRYGRVVAACHTESGELNGPWPWITHATAAADMRQTKCRPAANGWDLGGRVDALGMAAAALSRPNSRLAGIG